MGSKNGRFTETADGQKRVNYEKIFHQLRLFFYSGSKMAEKLPGFYAKKMD